MTRSVATNDLKKRTEQLDDDCHIEPAQPPDGQDWLAQSLAQGAAGIALLHIELARSGTGSWRGAHAWICAAVSGEVSAGNTSGLFQGLPAVAFVLHAAASGAPRYATGLAEADRHVTALATSRADEALARIRSGRPTTFHEYDVFFGLTGLGALLLRRDPAGSAMERVLRYLVALTRPLVIDGREVPGWWVGHDPRRRQSPDYPGGHLNFGAAHGVAGPLALLGHTLRHGVAVDGQRDAVASILAFLDTWRQESHAGPWWPEWITITDYAAGRPAQQHANRPSWCYGTPGIARAGQIAAIALGDTTAQKNYEQAITACLRDPAQVAKVTESGLCHGAAGLYMTAMRAAEDTAAPDISTRLPVLADLLLSLAASNHGPGFLNGADGTALALQAAAEGTPLSGWDACLLIS
jgi:hypothetical protein